MLILQYYLQEDEKTNENVGYRLRRIYWHHLARFLKRAHFPEISIGFEENK